jgi:hypothetical protein
MKMEVNYTVTANKEAYMSDCTCEEEEEHSPFLRFPIILLVRWQNIWP